MIYFMLQQSLKEPSSSALESHLALKFVWSATFLISRHYVLLDLLLKKNIFNCPVGFFYYLDKRKMLELLNLLMSNDDGHRAVWNN